MPHALTLLHPAAQLLHPLLGPGDLVAAGLGEHPDLLVLAHRVQGDVGELAGVVNREDEVAGVPGGAAGVGQRPLVELDDVGPAELGEVVDEGVPDDARADDDAAGGGGGGPWAGPSWHSSRCVIRNATLIVQHEVPAWQSGGGMPRTCPRWVGRVRRGRVSGRPGRGRGARRPRRPRRRRASRPPHPGAVEPEGGARDADGRDDVTAGVADRRGDGGEPHVELVGGHGPAALADLGELACRGPRGR